MFPTLLSFFFFSVVFLYPFIIKSVSPLMCMTSAPTNLFQSMFILVVWGCNFQLMIIIRTIHLVSINQKFTKFMLVRVLRLYLNILNHKMHILIIFFKVFQRNFQDLLARKLKVINESENLTFF